MNLSRLFLMIGYSSLSAVMIASEPPNYKPATVRHSFRPVNNAGYELSSLTTMGNVQLWCEMQSYMCNHS